MPRVSRLLRTESGPFRRPGHLVYTIEFGPDIELWGTDHFAESDICRERSESISIVYLLQIRDSRILKHLFNFE